MARVYDENGKIVGTTESIDIRLNQANELYNSANLDEALKELAKVFDIDKQLLMTKLLLGLDEENQKLNKVFTTNDTSDNDYGGRLLFQLKDYNGNFTITEDDITTNSPSGTTVTYTLDETTKTLKVSSTTTNTNSNKAYRGIKINNIPKIDVDFNKKAVSVVIKCKTNAPVNINNIQTNQDYFIGVDDNGFSSYKSIKFYYPFYNNNNNYYISIEYNGAFDIEIENIRYYVINKLPTIEDIHNVNVKVANMNMDMNLDGLAPLDSPDFTGDISLGRKEGTTVGENSFAVGSNVTASSKDSHAEGYGTTASGSQSHAEGWSTTTTGSYSHSEGMYTEASGANSHAEGNSTKAKGQGSHVEGYYTTATSSYSHVEGKCNIEDTENKYVHIVGNGYLDNGTFVYSNAHTLDWNGNAWYQGTVSCDGTPTNDNDLITKKYFEENKGTGEGGSVDLSGYAPLNSPVFTGSISLGRDADITVGTNSFAVGTSLIASGANSHAEGYGSSAYGGSSHAEGYSTTTTGTYSHAEGNYTTASGSSSHSEGDNTKARGNYSHAEGRNTTALGDKSHAEGYSTNTAGSKVSSLSTSTANDTIITAWNSNKFSLAKGDSSHVEGKDNLALGSGSHAEGGSTIASGLGSHAEGCETTASGLGSHAEGEKTTASGEASHAECYLTTASGDFSHAEGKGTIASGVYQHVQGRYNLEDTEDKYAHIVGNGNPASGKRSNAHTLDWNGNAWYKGELYTGGTSQADANKVLTTADISFNEAGELVVTIGGVSKTFVPKSE